MPLGLGLDLKIGMVWDSLRLTQKVVRSPNCLVFKCHSKIDLFDNWMTFHHSKLNFSGILDRHFITTRYFGSQLKYKWKFWKLRVESTVTIWIPTLCYKWQIRTCSLSKSQSNMVSCRRFILASSKGLFIIQVFGFQMVTVSFFFL